MRHSRFIAITIMMVLAAGGSASAVVSNSLYTVQTGTFVPYDPALRQFNALAASLAKPLRGLLRIEKGPKFHVVRLGLFKNPAEAWKAAKEVEAVAPDAFVLREPAGTVDRLVLLAPDITGTDITGTHRSLAVEAGCFTSKDAAMNAFSGMLLESGGDRASAKPVGNGADFAVRIDGLSGIEAVWNTIRQMSTLSSCVSISKADALLPPAESATGAIVQPKGGVSSTMVEPAALKDDAVEKATQPAMAAPKAAPQTQASDAAASPTGESIGNTAGDTTDDMEKTFVRINDTMSAMLDRHEYGKAVQVIREYLKRYPDNPDLYAWYGAALSAMDRPDKALEQYRRAAELAPSVPEFHINVGQSLTKIHMSSVKDAIESFNAALRLNPNNVEALEGLGSVYVSIGYGDMAGELVLPRIQALDGEAAKRLDALIKGGVDWSR